MVWVPSPGDNIRTTRTSLGPSPTSSYSPGPRIHTRDRCLGGCLPGLDNGVPTAQRYLVHQIQHQHTSDTSWCQVGHQTLGEDRHSSLASPEPNRCCRSNSRKPCQYGSSHHSNSACMDPSPHLRMSRVQRIAPQLCPDRCCPSHLGHSPPCSKNSSCALSETLPQHFRFCTTADAGQWSLTLERWS